jgi:hypothetical protein
MTYHRRYGAVFAFVLLTGVTSVWAQADPTVWRRGTTLNVFGGVASASGDRAPLAGAALGWEVTPRIGFEASGSWLDWGHSAHGFAATMRALVPLRPSRSVAPFVAAGAGLYRASFHIADRAMPGFYRRRVDARPEVYLTSATFTDPSIAFRPEMDATVVMRDRRTRTFPTLQIHLAYHFEDHPITPTRTPTSHR